MTLTNTRDEKRLRFSSDRSITIRLGAIIACFRAITRPVQYHLRSTCTKKGPRDANAAVQQDPRPSYLGLEPAQTASLCGSFSGTLLASGERFKYESTYLILCVQGHDTCFMCSDDRLTGLDNIGTNVTLQFIREQKQEETALK
jgi:hypothetical protein